jgi:hypothetical protein
MSNNSYVQKGKLTLLSLFAIAIGGLISCSSAVESINKSGPVPPTGEKTLTLTVVRASGDALGEYDLVINGADPVTTSETTTVIDVTGGSIYTISATKTGYSGKSKTRTLDVPVEDAASFTDNMTLTLTKLNDPVTIVAEAGGVIDVAPIGGTVGGGAASLPTVVTVPPGALPAGTTEAISVTPIAVESDDAEAVQDTGITNLVYEFAPSGLVFESPITIEIPLNLSAAQVAANVDITFEYTASDGIVEIVPIDVSADGKTGTVEIDHFSEWYVVQAYEFSFDAVQVNQVTSSSECGGSLVKTSVVFNSSITAPGTLFTALFGNIDSFTTGSVNVAASTNQIATIKSNFERQTYVIRDFKTKATKERGTIYKKFTGNDTPTYVVCHDSGG